MVKANTGTFVIITHDCGCDVDFECDIMHAVVFIPYDNFQEVEGCVIWALYSIM